MAERKTWVVGAESVERGKRAARARWADGYYKEKRDVKLGLTLAPSEIALLKEKAQMLGVSMASLVVLAVKAYGNDIDKLQVAKSEKVGLKR